MKKVGLCIQFENVDNYGSVLQALATKLMVERYGYDVRLIRYIKKYNIRYVISQLPRFKDMSTWVNITRGRKREKAMNKSIAFSSSMEAKRGAFKKFRMKYFPESIVDEYYGYKSLEKGADRYDTLLVGSDQLWLPAGLYTGFYNLNFSKSDKVKKISCATSFGVSVIPSTQKKATAQYLNKFDYLSVREVSGCKIIEELTGRVPFLSCDPVMLLDRGDWENIINDVLLPKGIEANRYILCYFLGGNVEFRNKAIKLAKEKNLKLVPIKFIEDYYEVDEEFGDICPTGLLPEVFIKLIKEANCILTDSFHGTAFSIIFEKKFLSLYRFNNTSIYSKNTRIDSILDKLKLKDRLYTEGDMLSKMDSYIDYSIVTKIVEFWREESRKFLKKGLEA